LDHSLLGSTGLENNNNSGGEGREELDASHSRRTSSSSTNGNNDNNNNNNRGTMVRSVLEKADEENESIVALTSDSDAEMLLELDQLLPDPCEEEEAHQSILDGIAELHGRESVKVDEKTGDPERKAPVLVARVLLFYDFLQKGILIKK
jgi:hypothetical protein